MDFSKDSDFVRKFLYIILINFGIPLKLGRVMKVYLNETYYRARVVSELSDKFPIENGLKQGDALSPLLFSFALEYAVRRVQVKQDGGICRHNTDIAHIDKHSGTIPVILARHLLWLPDDGSCVNRNMLEQLLYFNVF